MILWLWVIQEGWNEARRQGQSLYHLVLVAFGFGLRFGYFHTSRDPSPMARASDAGAHGDARTHSPPHGDSVVPFNPRAAAHPSSFVGRVANA